MTVPSNGVPLLDRVFWNRRVPSATLITVGACIAVSIALDGTELAYWFSAVLGFPLAVEAVWLWGWSCRLRVDDRGIRISSLLPYVYRCPWEDLARFSAVRQTATIPLFWYVNLRVDHRSGRFRRCGEVGFLDGDSGKARMQELVEELERIRREVT